MMMIALFFSGLAMLAGIIMSVTASILLQGGMEMVETFISETQVIYCDELSLTEIEPVCDYIPLLAIPFEAEEIIQITHPEIEGTVMIYEDATRLQTVRHIEATGAERIPGAFEGYIELPEFLQEEMGIHEGDPTTFTWEVSFWDNGMVIVYISSDIELERTILYIP